MKMILAD